MKTTFLESMGRFLPAKAAFNFFRDLLLQHSVQRPPYSVGLFCLQDVTAITDFASRSFFRHYMLYKYCFTKKTEMAFSTICTYSSFTLSLLSMYCCMRVLTTCSCRIADTYTLAPTDDLPAGFLQPLSAGEDELKKLKREEEEALAAVKEPEIEVTPEDLEKANVPDTVREDVLNQVNAQISDMKKKMEEQMQEQVKEMESRLAALKGQIHGT